MRSSVSDISNFDDIDLFKNQFIDEVYQSSREGEANKKNPKTSLELKKVTLVKNDVPPNFDNTFLAAFAHPSQVIFNSNVYV